MTSTQALAAIAGTQVREIWRHTRLQQPRDPLHKERIAEQSGSLKNKYDPGEQTVKFGGPGPILPPTALEDGALVEPDKRRSEYLL